MHSLVIFDIDGTLTDTYAVDDECYRDVVSAVIGLAPNAVDWSGAAHVTDAGIFRFLCTAHGRAEPSASDVASTRATFVDRLTTELERDPARFRSVPGAAAALRSLGDRGWAAAVATGGWGASARLKLRAAQILIADDLLACADDATARADIVELARARAESFHQCTFSRVVSVGDGPWDVEAAATLRLPFVGIGTGERVAALRRAGAGVVLADYADLTAFWNALASAPVPASSS